MNDSENARTATARRRARADHDPLAPPAFIKALVADARIAAAYRGERADFRSRLDGVVQALRLMIQSEAFFALAAYRLKARLRAIGIPVLPWIAHRLAVMSAHISISDSSVLGPGVCIPNGQIVVDGEVVIHWGTVLLPWVTIAPLGNEAVGPTIGPCARIGTGAKVLGEIEIGSNSRVGANAVVLNDVPPATTAVGMPARAMSE